MGNNKSKRLPFLEQTDLNAFVKIVKKNFQAVRKAIGHIEEPYSEMTQNYKDILIKVTLPDILVKHLTLRMIDRTVEIKAEQKSTNGKTVKTYYRSIELPSSARLAKASAQYVRGVLHISVPQDFTSSLS